MKIIFDSEEQKEDFITNMAHHHIPCPSYYGLSESYPPMCKYDTCKECWKNALYIEVKEDVNNENDI